MTATTTEPIRQINHAEMLYRPGERALTGRVFELLGLRVVDRGTDWLYALADPLSTDLANNAIYASEVTSEQWALEQALASAIDGTPGDGSVGAAARSYLDRVRTEPQRSFHFGIRYRRRDDFEATLDRIRGASTDPELAGRVELLGVFLPDAPGALAPNMIQAFARTDVVAAGLLAFGQHIEMQWHLSDQDVATG